jgi:hypothetical protein
MTTVDEIESGGNNRLGRAGASCGMALISTLLIMSLMIAMTLAMTISMSSDMLITRYYRNFRSSFYAADSGTNIVRQYMANQIVSAIPATFSSTTQPIPAGTETTVGSAILTNYGSSATAANLNITSGAAAGSWPGRFNIASSPAPSLTLTSCTPHFTAPTGGGTVSAGSYNCTTGLPTCTGTCTGFAITDYQYVYNYSFTSMGQSTASEQAQVQDTGQINIHVNVAPAGGTTTSFAAWGMFIDQFTICSADLVGGTISGPVFTNGAWTYSTTSVGYTYTDSVGSVSPNFGYDFGGGTCDQKNSASDKVGGATIAPNFQSGYKLGQSAIPLPTDSYNQKRAVLDGLGTNDTNPTQGQMGAALRNAATTVYPSSGSLPSSGVYMSYSSTTSGGSTVNQMQGGGIYVAGSADSVMLTASSASGANNPVSGMGNGDSLQVVTIKQGSTTTTVYLDQTNSTTYMKSGSSVTAIAGLPQNKVTTPNTAGTMVYVDGNIGTSSSTGLSGPGQGVAAIQNGAGMTVSANGNINITGDLLYKTPPINIPADTIAVPSSTNPEVLGIYTANGNINLYNQQSNGNLEIDASLATLSSGGSGGLVNPGSGINTLTILGGRIQNTIQNINTTTRNVWFDRRFAQGGFAPPWFPSTTIVPSATDSATGATTTFNRTSWLAPNQ